MSSEIEILRDYIRDEIGHEGEVADGLDLLNAQILDSFSIVQVAVFIQDRFAIELDANDLVRENLATLSAMATLIAKRRAAEPNDD